MVWVLHSVECGRRKRERPFLCLISGFCFSAE
jgi:hypothetical protein